MRLIDVEEAKQFLKENLILPRKSYEAIARTMLDAVPTAYDVDKVVEQLNKERNQMYREDESIISSRTNVSIDKAVEIVKSGGINKA